MGDKKHVCSICGKEYDGDGNNAKPVNDGRCCDECNANVVIPRRLADLNKSESSDTKKLVYDFLEDFYKIKYDMVLRAKLEEVGDVNGPSDEFISGLFDETSKRLKELAERKLTDRVMQGILFGYIGVLSDDLELVFAMYEMATGRRVNLIGIDLDCIFN